MSNENVTFLGVGRAADQTILASSFIKMSQSERGQIEATFSTCVNEALVTFAPGSREKRVFGEGCMFLLADRNLTCIYAIGVRNTNYAERHAFAALADLMKVVGSKTDEATLVSCAPGALSRTVREEMKTIMRKFDKPREFDKVAEVSEKVVTAKEVMHENIVNMLEIKERLEDVEKKTSSLQEGASKFNKNANSVNRHMCVKTYKWTLILLVVLLAIALIAIPMAINDTRRDDQKDTEEKGPEGGNRRLLRGVLSLSQLGGPLGVFL